MSIQFSIFDAYGKLRSDLDTEVAAIEALPDDVRATLFECIKAVSDRDECSARVFAARRLVRDLETKHGAAIEADRKANPPATHHSELARVIAANQGRTIAPVKLNRKARTALAEVELALAEARITLQKATTEAHDLERVAGDKINLWRLCQTTPSAEEVTREYLARSGQERANAAAANPPTPHQPWPLETEMAARGKTKVNRTPTYFGPR